MRALLLCALVAGVVGAGLFACNPNSIGRPCVNPGGQAVLGTQVSSPALECPSRLCLLQPPNARPVTPARRAATAEPSAPPAPPSASSDSDCDAETTMYCKEGFKCAVATQAGPFCCKKLCICKSDLVEGVNVDADGGTDACRSRATRSRTRLRPARTSPSSAEGVLDVLDDVAGDGDDVEAAGRVALPLHV